MLHVDEHPQTKAAISYLVTLGIDEAKLQQLSAPAKRLLADGLRTELNGLGTLSPEKRREAESGVLKALRLALLRSNGMERMSGGVFAHMLESVGCENAHALQALHGITLPMRSDSR